MPDISVQDLIRQEAAKQGVPVPLALAVAEQESGFNPTAVNNESGAIGTFQFLPSTATARGIDPKDPVANIRGGVGYLRELLDKHQGDLQQVLAEYGGVKADTAYVPGVLGRLSKFQQAAAPPLPAVVGAPPPAAKPKPALKGMAEQLARTDLPPDIRAELEGLQPGGQSNLAAIAGGFDPRTREGRQNLAGGAGAAAGLALAPEITGPALLARALPYVVSAAGAGLGGGAEEAGEQALGQAPGEGGIVGAAKTQAKYDIYGQGLGWLGKAFARRVGAKAVAKGVDTGFEQAVQGVESRLKMQRTPVTPSQAGRMVTEVAEKPVKSVRDQMGRDIEAAAATGPAIPTQPLKDRLVELSQQVTPQVSHGPATRLPVSAGAVNPEGQAVIDRQRALLAQALPADHPLPALLDHVRETIGDADTIPFDAAHQLKRALDDAVNWDSPAKKQAQQITKGFRQTLRGLMSSHAPYEQATAAYAPLAKLYQKGAIPQLQKKALQDPEVLVRSMNWRSPTSARLAKEFTVDYAAQAGTGGQQMGEAAWNAVRAAWTQEKLIAKGAKGMAAEMQKMEASNSGQEFIQTLFSDPAGQTTWTNLKQLATRLDQITTEQAAFGRSTLAFAAGPASMARDLAYSTLHGHPITKVGAVARVVFGPSVKEMLQWASYSTPRTQFLINHVLTGPDPGAALADFARWYSGGGTAEEVGTPPPETTQGPGPVGTPPPGGSESPVSRTFQKYPLLRKLGDVNVVDSRARGMQDDRQLEYYAADEQDNPQPGKPTVEIFNPALRGQAYDDAVAADLLHGLKAVDPQWRQLRQQIIALRSPQSEAMDQRAYAEDKAHGETRSFDQWMEDNRADAYVRGYLFPDATDEWRRGHVYNDRQKQVLEQMRRHLTAPEQVGTPPPR